MSTPSYSESFRTEAISPIQNKIGKALIEPRLRNMLSQPKSTITLRRLMDEGAIVICNISKGALGESTAHLLGALLTTAFAQAALSRADIPGTRAPRVPSLRGRVPIVRHGKLRPHSQSRPASIPLPSPSGTSTSTSFPTNCAPPSSAMPARSSRAAPARPTPRSSPSRSASAGPMAGVSEPMSHQGNGPGEQGSQQQIRLSTVIVYLRSARAYVIL